MRTSDPAALLPGIDQHPHALAVLGGALAPGRQPSHAYLFHGPPGTGKREIARAFASALLADDENQLQGVTERVARNTHPDLIWVAPSGASEMLVSDIEEPVVAGATRTPFEAARRVFVIESAQSMNEQAANRMLKTLEEPPDFVHLILLADRREEVLATITSRCQQVRFDPLASEHIQRRLLGRGVEQATAETCARLALGDAQLADWLATAEGATLRAHAESFIRASLEGQTDRSPWSGLLDAARAAGELAGERAKVATEAELELLPKKEHRRHLREGSEAQRRAERRARIRALDRGLCMAELWLRDLWCVAQGAEELIHASDRRSELAGSAQLRQPGQLARGMELVSDTRLRLVLNVSETLALEALSYRLAKLFADPAD